MTAKPTSEGRAVEVAVLPEILDMPDVTELFESLRSRRQPDLNDQVSSSPLRRSLHDRRNRPVAQVEPCWKGEPDAELLESEFCVVTYVTVQPRTRIQGRR
jgi:hypothetical protein